MNDEMISVIGAGRRLERRKATIFKVMKRLGIHGRRLRERTAIDCVTESCDRLHTEVFRCLSLETVIAKCEQFFGMMPPIISDSFNQLGHGV
jgi:hypothetical protein